MTRYSSYLPSLVALSVLCVQGVGAQTAGCEQVSTEAILHGNGVRAKISNNGGLFWSGGRNVYTVDGSDALFTANLLIGALVDGELRTAATTYGPFEFWPGPADSIRTAADCERFNRTYRIALRDISAYEEGAEPRPDLLDWPWRLGAPVVDGDGNPDNYNLAGGDRPDMLGSEMVYWIMNDVGGTHARTGSAPLGVEVHGTAFAAPSTDPALNNATFYRYRIINRSDRLIRDAFVGFFVDPDLGVFSDDYVGSDSLASLAYAYNADNDDSDGRYGYGLNPPAVGFRMFEGPEASPDTYDNDYDGGVDEPGERLRMSHFVFYWGGGGVQGDPRDAADFYDYMRARWKDGEPFTEGGDGRNHSTKPVRFAFPADPPEYWSEMSTTPEGDPNPPADRRFIQSMGPFALAPGEETELFVGVLYARGADHLASRDLLEEYALRLEGLRPEDVGSDLGRQVVAAGPRINTPIDGSTGHLTDVTFDWARVSNALIYELQLERIDEPADVQSIEVRETSLMLSLEKNATYEWRVRGFNASDYGPWSDFKTVSTGGASGLELVTFVDAVVVRNAAGPLSEPVGATADWRGFPGTGPPNEGQQVGPARWLIHTYQGGRTTAEPGFDYFLRRSFSQWTEDAWGTTYEIRFEGESVAFDFLSGEIVNVPFQVWSLGRGTVDDASDDYRMVPWVLDWDLDGFGLSSFDHVVSEGDDDPELDAIYLLEPAVTAPGEAGYLTWAEAAADGSFEPEDHGPARIRRVTFVNWDAGPAGSDQIEQRVPEPGTVFRIFTHPRPAPILNAPATDAVLTSDNAVFQWTVYPNEPVTFEAARDADFHDVVLRVLVPGSTLEAPLLPGLSPGRYYWRVSADGAGVSRSGSYLVGTTVNAEPDSEIAEHAILDVYPVPATTGLSIRLRLPASERAALSVFDVLGRRVLYDDVDVTGGESVLNLATERLPPGAYFVRIAAAGTELSARFVVAPR